MSEVNRPRPEEGHDERDVKIARINWGWVWPAILLILVAFMLFCSFAALSGALNPDNTPRLTDWWNLAWIGAVILAIPILNKLLNLMTVSLFYRWFTLSSRPFELMKRGKLDAANRAFTKALSRAQRFSAKDPRRGIMLVSLAVFRAQQDDCLTARPLFQEAVAILGQLRSKQIANFVAAVQNHGELLVTLKDYEAALAVLTHGLNLCLSAKKNTFDPIVRDAPHVLRIHELLIRMGMATVFFEIGEIAEGRHHAEAADAVFAAMDKAGRLAFEDTFHAFRVEWLLKVGAVDEASRELAAFKKRDTAAYTESRGKLDLRCGEYVAAEQALRKYKELEQFQGRRRHPLHVVPNLNLAEALFGQARHDDAFASFDEARSIVADFALPSDDAWRKALTTWLQRAKDMGRTELAASLEKELAQVSATPMQAITILEKFRIQPPDATCM